MFFYLSKLTYFIVMPITWLFVLLFLAYKTDNKRRRKRYLITILCLLIILSNPWISNSILKSYEYAPINMNSLKPTNLGVILTGVTKRLESGDNRVYFSKGADRVIHAVYLYNRGIIKKILVSGGSGSFFSDNERKESEKIKWALIEMGVSENDILIETKSRNTRENALFSAEIVKKEFPNEVPILITSAFHMRRSVGCFNKAGIKVVPLPVDYFTKHTRTDIKDFIPNGGVIGLWSLLVHECLGLVVYTVLGYA